MRVVATNEKLRLVRALAKRLARNAALGVLPAVLAFSGCSGSTQAPSAVRVGDVSISNATIGHWTAAIKLGNGVGTSLGKTSGTPRERALNFLISANWLMGEAEEQNLPVSKDAIEGGVRERMESVPNGRSEFEEELSSTGQTIDDVKLEVKAELAAEALRALVESRVPGVTSDEEVLDYYHRNITHFRVPEKRTVDLIESIPSRSAAVALGRRLGPGARFSKRALREFVARQTPAEAAHRDNAALVRGIFAATPNKVAPPAPFNGAWVLIVARGSVPGRTKGLKEVESEIERHLLAEWRRRRFAEFAKSLRMTWTAKTDCRPGFVVQKCSQYRGHLVPEGDLLSSG